MKGYLNNPTLTQETLDEVRLLLRLAAASSTNIMPVGTPYHPYTSQNGWLYTGDIGQWQINGSLRIIDRAKAMFKMAQGEYIAPEMIEQIYIRALPVAMCFVHGRPLEAFLVAIVVIDTEAIVGWLKVISSLPSVVQLALTAFVSTLHACFHVFRQRTQPKIPIQNRSVDELCADDTVRANWRK